MADAESDPPRSTLDAAERLGLEILNLLESRYLLDSISWESLLLGDKHHRVRQFKIVLLSTNDIVMILGKLIDSRRDALGAPQVIKALRSAKAPPEQIARAVAALERLTGLVEPVMMRYRDTRLAHIGKAEYRDSFPAIDPAIRAAVELVDVIAGTRQEYKELDVDLRHAVFGEPRREPDDARPAE